jgi:DNA-binding protein H-NS
LLLDTNREISSELTKEKTKYRLIPCLVKRRQENAEYAYEEGQQILINFNSRTNVLLATQYATSRMVPSTNKE